MSEQKFIMMIGFPGSGKSTYAEKLSKQHENSVICSSDALRLELYGSESVQDHNEDVFRILMKRMKQYLSDGRTVIYDAMNISSKYRRATLLELSKYNCSKTAYLIATPYEMCLSRNNIRDRHVPEDVIKRAYMNFNTPCKQEGFNSIEIVYPNDDVKTLYKDVPMCYIDTPHDNPHHSSSIGQHMFNASSYLEEHYSDVLSTSRSLDSDILFYATILHDIGKPFTKTFTNSRGEPTDIAHYYNHHNVGAYNCLFTDIQEDTKLDVSLLIQYHMNYYLSWKQSPKSEQKDRAFLGPRLSKMLDILHDCDLHAH